ncbi:MAG: hypothetical protein K6G65_02515 [Lachnospiraceae bacterium]|nr:hypothetical protein [Lachnospiraceae bacterium]
MNSFSRIVEIIVTVILLFIVPVYLMGEQAGWTEQIHTMEQLSFVVNTVSNKGVMSSQMYHQLQNNLNRNGSYYRLEVEVYHLNTQVDYYGDSYNSTSDHWEYVNTKQIEESIEQQKGYSFYKGDYVRLTAIKQNTGLSQRIQRLLFGRELLQNAKVTYGGTIRNEAF